MAKVDLEAALKAVEPVTKAAQMRKVMPIIEAQLQAGVRRQAILDVLKSQGIDLGMETFKSYLHRYRKSIRQDQKPGVTQILEEPLKAGTTKEESSVSYDVEPDASPQITAPLGPTQLSKIMNPGEDKNASEMARYESAGKRTRRKT